MENNEEIIKWTTKCKYRSQRKKTKIITNNFLPIIWDFFSMFVPFSFVQYPSYLLFLPALIFFPHFLFHFLWAFLQNFGFYFIYFKIDIVTHIFFFFINIFCPFSAVILHRLTSIQPVNITITTLLGAVEVTE